MSPQKPQFDVIVIGAGPAGMSAALWCADLGLTAALVERRAEPGGQLLWTHGPIENYPGVKTANGPELRDIFSRQLEGREIRVFYGAGVQSLDPFAKTVELADGPQLYGRAVVFATGVRRRSLGIPGEAEFLGKGILHSGRAAGGEVAGKRVVVVGGGDAALENALILSEGAANVTVVHRRGEFIARDEFVLAASDRPNVDFRFNTRLTAIVGDGSVRAVDVTSFGKEARLDCQYVLIRIGVEPNVELLRDAIELDEHGYVRVGSDCSTNVDAFYAVGDVASPVSPTIATAVGMGATAAKAITARLERC
jgi:thioredoxin reductase (NADPH)